VIYNCSEVAGEAYQLHLDASLEVVHPDRARVLGAALSYEATAYDAVYVALALGLDARVLTAERTTTPWVVEVGERVDSVRRR
jgi:predicted nucleic acid-binding protein